MSRASLLSNSSSASIGAPPAPPPYPRHKKKKRENVTVVARFRPLSKREEREDSPKGFALLVDDKSNIVAVRRPLEKGVESHNFAFDHVFGPNSEQVTVFAEVGEDAIQFVTEGFNSTIFAYGQTGTGKTFTMFGPSSAAASRGKSASSDHNSLGIIPRVGKKLFEILTDDPDLVEATIKCSFLEIYKERIRDLLSLPNTSGADVGKRDVRTALKLRQSPGGGVYVHGLREKHVGSAEEISSLIKSGEEARMVASTNMNERSSRSHTVFTLTVTKLMANGLKKTGKLNLVDLAGSENVRKTKATGSTLKEAQQINKSLSALGNVIYSLTGQASHDHIPYRDSRLTYLLQDSLGGNTKTVLLVTCSPHALNVEETISTLKFAKRAKLIKNKPHVNKEESPEQLRSLLLQMEEALTVQNAEMRKMESIFETLGIERKEDGNYSVPTGLGEASPEETNALKAELAQVKSRNVGLTRYNDLVVSKYSKLKSKFLEEIKYVKKLKSLFLKQRALAKSLAGKIERRDKLIQSLQDGAAPTQGSTVTTADLINSSKELGNRIEFVDDEYSPPPSPKTRGLGNPFKALKEARNRLPVIRGGNTPSGSIISVAGPADSDPQSEVKTRPPSQSYVNNVSDSSSDLLDKFATSDPKNRPRLSAEALAEKVLERGNSFLKYPYDPKFKFLSKPTTKQLFFEKGSRQLFYWDVGKGINTTCKSIKVADITSIYMGAKTPVFEKHAIDSVHEAKCFSIEGGGRTLDFEAASEEERDQWLAAIYIVAKKERRSLGLPTRIGVHGAVDTIERAFTLSAFPGAERATSIPEGDETVSSGSAEPPIRTSSDDEDEEDSEFLGGWPSSTVDTTESTAWLTTLPLNADGEPLKVKALWSYTARSKKQLMFQKGDIMTVLQKNDSGWWRARLGHKDGLIPSNYVKEVKGKR